MLGPPAVAVAARGGMRLDHVAADAERVERLELRVPLPEPMPPVEATGCGGDLYVSCTGPGLPIFLAPGAIRPREDYWHELGHHVDYTLLNDWLRDRFRWLIGDPRPWRTSPNSPHEEFAEAYAACALRLGTRDGLGHGYDYRPSKRRHRRVCLFMTRL